MLVCSDSYCVWCCACDKHYALLESFPPGVLKHSVDSREAAHFTVQCILGRSLKHWQDLSPPIFPWFREQSAVCSLSMESLCQTSSSIIALKVNQWCWFPYTDLPKKSGRKAGDGHWTAEVCEAVRNSSAEPSTGVSAWGVGKTCSALDHNCPK